MKIKSTLEEHFEAVGEDHVSSAEETPMRADAFVLTNRRKLNELKKAYAILC